MSEETLLTASRRVVRFFRIDMEKGGFVTEQTEWAIEQLDRMVYIEGKKNDAGRQDKSESKQAT